MTSLIPSPTLVSERSEPSGSLESQSIPSFGGLLAAQRGYFASGATRVVADRKAQLTRLLKAIEAHQDDLLGGLYQDLRKPAMEAFSAEIGTVMGDLKQAIQQLDRWARPVSYATGPLQFPGKASLQAEPLGVVLIIGAWNYPVNLVLAPLVGAIAAGNCAIVKPSEYVPATNAVLRLLIESVFPAEFVAWVEGDAHTSQALLQERFDHIFFTGGSAIGKRIMAAAAQHLTPVTLELGGKSPCLVAADVDLAVAARRIVWGKFLNAGQTCVAPDYLLVEERIKPALVGELQKTIGAMYGPDPAQSPDLARIVSDRHFDRLVGFLPTGAAANQTVAGGQLVAGGQSDRADRYIAPTLLDNVQWTDGVMQEEIFGPILPILTYRSLDEAIALVNQRPKPLALYFFGRDRAQQEQVLAQTSSGGVCVNDTMLHLTVTDLPFGGVGASGMGSYHGKASFDLFSHRKAVLRRGFSLDIPMRYAPYPKDLGLMKKFL
jgi:aldehyde dehydrogenase (NAD+)